MSKKKPKCLLIYSGGLDSTLAVKVLEKQGVEVTAINFVSYFFGSGTSKKTAKANNINLRIFDDEDWKKKHWEIVQRPKYGHGKAINPCIDCHLLMLRTAGEIMKEEGFDFVASGEVWGERPKSQNPRALKLIEKKCGVEGYLLRPLSAKLMEPTLPEKEGLIDREQLLDISGKGRRRQMDLAEELGVKIYPTPAGGCILTEKKFAERMFELIEKIGDKNITPNDIALAKFGRLFHLEDGSSARVTLGRNKKENEKIKSLVQKGDIFIAPNGFSGPSALLRGKNLSDEVIEESKKLIIKYSKVAEGEKLEFEVDENK